MPMTSPWRKLAQHAADLDDDGHDTTATGAPSDATYLVTTAHAGLSAEVPVGATPGGELGGTWASPTVDGTHSGSSHAGLSGQPGSTDVAVADGGTGASTAAGARTNLGLVIGTDVDAFASLVSQAEAEAGTATTIRNWTAERVKQAIAALASGSGISASTVDAKGDLIVGTANDTVARLAAGANDTILMADSAQSTGLKYVASQTPSTQAFSDAAAEGTADTYARGDHKHGMMASPGGGISSGTSNPGSPSNNDLFYRTDLDLIIFYDGTRWLTTTLYRLPLDLSDASPLPFAITGLVVGRAQFGNGGTNDHWVTNIHWAFHVLTTNTGAAYWGASLDRGGGAGTFGSANTSANGPNAWIPKVVAVNALAGTTVYEVESVATKTGSPGNAYIKAAIEYRIVVT